MPVRPRKRTLIYTRMPFSSVPCVWLQAAEPLLERNIHPTVLVRGYSRALEDALKASTGRILSRLLI